MHELSIAKGIFNTVAGAVKDQKIKAVKEIRLSMGGMLDYEALWIARYINELGKDTPLSETKVVINKLPISFRCRSCGDEFAFDKERDAKCRKCGSTDFDLTGGRELYIESIEVEDDENL